MLHREMFVVLCFITDVMMSTNSLRKESGPLGLCVE